MLESKSQRMRAAFLGSHESFVKKVPLKRHSPKPGPRPEHAGIVNQQDAITIAVPPLREECSLLAISNEAHFVGVKEALLHHSEEPLNPMVFPDDVPDALKGGFAGAP